MKIDLNGSTPELVITPRASNQDAPSTNEIHNAGEDKTTLSYGHANIGALTAQAMSAASVRQDKVEALRQQISDGQYKVEPDKIAEAMLKADPK